MLVHINELKVSLSKLLVYINYLKVSLNKQKNQGKTHLSEPTQWETYFL